MPIDTDKIEKEVRGHFLRAIRKAEKKRKTDPIDDKIHELNKPILLLRELKKAKQEIAQLKYQQEEMEKYYSKPIEIEARAIAAEERNADLERSYNDQILQERKDSRYRELHDLVMALSQRNGQLEEELKRLKNATP
jgi:hypothetical protein